MSTPNALIMKLSDLLGPTYVPVNLNTGLDLNGNCPADASVAINGFIGQATAKLPAILIFDIGVACYGSILLPTAENKAAYPSIVTGDGAGHVSLIGMGWDTGIYMMPGSNSHCISGHPGRLGDGKYPVFDPGGTAPAQSNLNIRIAGLAINGNRGTGAAVATPTATTTLGSNQITVSAATSIAIGQLVTGTGLASPSFVSAIAGTTVTLVDQTGKPANATANGSGVTVSFWASNSTTGDPTGINTASGGFNNATRFCGISIFSAQNVVIDKCNLHNLPAYSLRTSNVTGLQISGHVYDGGAISGTNYSDGIHIDGPGTKINVSDCNLSNIYNDAIALNAPEGYGGNITNVTINGVNVINGGSLMRLYTTFGSPSPQWSISNVAVSNITGNQVNGKGQGVSLGYTKNTANAAYIDRVSFANIFFETDSGANNAFFFVNEGVGDFSMVNCVWTPGNSTLAPFIGSGFFGIGATGVVINRVRIDACRFVRKSGNAPSCTAVYATGDAGTITINTLDIDLQFEDAIGLSASANPYFVDPTHVVINKLILRNLDTANVAALINGSTWTNLPSITGEGLVGCGFQIPDANVGNNTMYKSATTAGELTWKDGAGAVHGLAAGS